MKGFVSPKYGNYVFSFYMAGIMAFLMSCVSVATNTGIVGDYLGRVCHAYLIAFPTAFVCISLVRPIVLKLVNNTIKTDCPNAK